MIARRTFLKLSAAALCGAGLAGYRPSRQVWTGAGFGAELSIILRGPQDGAQAAFAGVERQIDHLEDVFSLYRPHSAISRLNRDGVLINPPPELVEVLSLSQSLWRHSAGAFDPTIQARWRARAGRDGTAPLGFQHVRTGRDQIRFTQPGMAITLNGIAHGYASDQIAAGLRGLGYGAHLVDLGEFVAGDGAWRLGIENDQGRRLATPRIANVALATSAPGALHRADNRSHILHPDGRAPYWKTVSVQADCAAVADGCSTAMTLMTADRIARLDLAALGVRAVWLEGQDGRVTRLG